MGHHHHGAHDRAPILRVVILTIGLKALAAVMEGITAYISHSYSLGSDTLHLLVDILAGTVGAVFLWRGQRAPSGHRQGRIEMGGAVIVGLLILVMAALVTHQVWHHHGSHEVTSLPMLGAAMAGLMINLANLWLLSRSTGIILVHMLWQHEALDFVSSILVILAAATIMATGYTFLDIVGSISIGSFLFGWGLWQLFTVYHHGGEL